jgi:hypothetical protein
MWDGTILLMNNLTIRSATAADTAALAHQAALDSATIPAEPVFVAELGDRLIAAVSARDGAAIADPFTRSADAVEIARRRAQQLAGTPKPRRRLTLSGHGQRALSW